MARSARFSCVSCEAWIDAGGAFCGRCGHPTVWATHEERTAWEVQQWRKGRAGSAGLAPAAVLTLPIERAQSQNGESVHVRPPDLAASRPERIPVEPGHAMRWLKELVSTIRRLFGSKAMIALDPPPAPVPQAAPVVAAVLDVMEPAPPVHSASSGAPHETARALEPPGVQDGPTQTPPKPRKKRPNPPTNKDMLKLALSVLSKVEERLQSLEQDVAGIDEAVRNGHPEPDDRAERRG